MGLLSINMPGTFATSFEIPTGSSIFLNDFSSGKPIILFNCDYIVNGKFEGCLLVWKKYKDSTHYEIFKKNLFSNDNSFFSILFLDSKNLEKETKKFIDYVKNDLKMDTINEQDIYIILDKTIKRDRIYEYKIEAIRTPLTYNEVDYFEILAEKQKIDFSPPFAGNLEIFSNNYLNQTNRGWIVCLLNKEISFFNRKIFTNLDSFYQNNIYFPKSVDEVLLIIKDSIELFGIKDTFKNIFDLIGGSNIILRDSYLKSINENKMNFSYYIFQTEFKKQATNFSFEGIEVPNTPQGSYSFQTVSSLATIDDIGIVFKFLNNVFMKYTNPAISGMRGAPSGAI